MSVCGVVSTKQSVRGNKKAFSLILSTLFLTVVLGSPLISLAQEEVKATSQKTACSAAEDQQAGASQCTQADAKANESKVTGGPQAGAIKIYSNLGPSGKPFDPTAGLAVSGPGSQPGTQAIGFPCIPKTSVNLEGIELPAGWISGLNSVDVCIYSDSGGFPGITIECITIYNLYPFGEKYCSPTASGNCPARSIPGPAYASTYGLGSRSC